MKNKYLNLISFNTPSFKNQKNRSKKINNKFKKSSTAHNPRNSSRKSQYINNNINNNIYLNLFNKFNSNIKTSSLKQIISNKINKKKNLNLNLNNSYKHHINIRLNLNNNSNSNFFNDDGNNNNDLDIEEKIQEKNLKIINLQNELLKSQEIINNHSRFTTNNNLNKNRSNKKHNSKRKNKNSFLKKSRINENNIIKINSNRLYTNYNIKNKKNDYLKLFLPISNFSNLYNFKPRFNSYSNNRKKNKNKINYDIILNSSNNSENDFSNFVKKCENLKTKTQKILDKYVELINYLAQKKTKE